MAAKVFFLLALTAVLVSAENGCNCKRPSEKELTSLWEFLTKLSTAEDTDPNDKSLQAVLPGELSPLLDCNCLEKNRRKRRIMPKSDEEIKENETTESGEVNEDILEKLRTSKCPRGFVWYGIMCVEDQYVLDK